MAAFSGELKDGREFTVFVVDNGEPGAEDRITLRVEGQVIFSGELGPLEENGGGNIQVHRPLVNCEKAMPPKNDE